MRSTRHPLLALAALACACDPQADGKYLGEPLASFDGYVSRAGVAPLEAAMLWQRGPPPSANDQELATRAPVRTGFPASFTLHLYQPPPAAARRTLAPLRSAPAPGQGSDWSRTTFMEPSWKQAGISDIG